MIRVRDASDAYCAAERLREVIAERPIAVPRGAAQITVTVSIGLVVGGTATAPRDAAALIDLADRGLYAAKAGGRDQVTVGKTAA